MRAARGFLGEHAAHDVVQAVGLAGRPVVRDVDARHATGIAARHAVDLRARRRIVRIDAAVDVIRLVLERVRRVLDHRGDHLVLLPGRHHDGEVRLRFFQELAELGAVRAQIVFAPPESPQPVAGIDEGVVGARDEDNPRQQHREHEQRP